MASKRKQDEKHLNLLRAMAKLDHNKQCIDCNQRGPTYLNMTIGAYVCTSCSGLLRGLNPPHRVKSISMASFTPEELEYVKSRGNEFCRKVWLGLHDTRNVDFLDKDENKIKDFMVLKYEKKRYYVAPTETMIEEARQHNTPPKVESQTKPLRPLGNIPNISVQHPNLQVSERPTASKTVPVTSISQPDGLQNPKSTRGVDLLGELGGDPFASSKKTQLQLQGFADFGAVEVSTTPVQMSHSLSQPAGFSSISEGGERFSPMSYTISQSIETPSNTHSIVNQSNSFGAFPISTSATSVPIATTQETGRGGSGDDKYSALAELDSVFGGVSSGSKTVNWDGANEVSSGVYGGGNSGARVGSGVNVLPISTNTQSIKTSAGDFTAAPNPFGTNTSQMNPSGGMCGNPFSPSGTEVRQSYSVFTQPGGFGGQGNTPTNMNTGAFNSPFGNTNIANSNINGPYSLLNGNMPPLTQQVWGINQQVTPQQMQMDAFKPSGSSHVGMSFDRSNIPGAVTGHQFGKLSQSQSFGQVNMQQFGGENLIDQQQAANPFMNIANQQASRSLNSTNPFL